MAFQQFPQKGGIPSGNTAGRPSSPVIGDTYYNGQSEILEIYNGTQWVASSAPPATPSIATPTDSGTANAFTSGGELTVVFTPGSGGGTPSQYNAYTTAGGFFANSSSTTVTLTGLTPGTAFTVYGNAQNNFGTTVNSPNAAAVIPTTKPQAPTIGTATASTSAAEITVTWTLGSTGGKNLSAITITPYLNGTTAETSRTAATTSSTSYTFTTGQLTSAASYTFKVKTTNANGDSPESSATSSVSVPISVEYLVVAGGGGGGGQRLNDYAYGGGGAGGFGAGTTFVSVSSALTTTVGAGGTQAVKGSNSVFALITRTGGGAGGGTNLLSNGYGDAGGSGGGSMGQSASQIGAGNEGGYSPVEGYAGGKGNDSSSTAAGGGGGSSAVGADAGAGGTTGGNGGAGTASSITGTSVTYAGGGGGGQGYVGGAGGTGGTGGSGGGGNGTAGGSGGNGTANRGGGGGGTRGGQGNTSGSGGSGVVIIKYADTYTPTISGGLTSSTAAPSGGYKVTTFTAGTGTVTF